MNLTIHRLANIGLKLYFYNSKKVVSSWLFVYLRNETNQQLNIIINHK